MYFRCKFPDAKVLRVDPKLKASMFEQSSDYSIYAKRKKASTYAAQKLIEEHEDKFTPSLKQWFSSLRKKDDGADALLMLKSWKKRFLT
jgi:hypothetical protein